MERLEKYRGDIPLILAILILSRKLEGKFDSTSSESTYLALQLDVVKRLRRPIRSGSEFVEVGEGSV